MPIDAWVRQLTDSKDALPNVLMEIAVRAKSDAWPSAEHVGAKDVCISDRNWFDVVRCETQDRRPAKRGRTQQIPQEIDLLTRLPKANRKLILEKLDGDL